MKKTIIKLVPTLILTFLFLTPLTYGSPLNKQEITVAFAGGDIHVPWSHSTSHSLTKQDSVSFLGGGDNVIVPWSQSNEYNVNKEKNISFYGGSDDVYLPW